MQKAGISSGEPSYRNPYTYRGKLKDTEGEICYAYFSGAERKLYRFLRKD